MAEGGRILVANARGQVVASSAGAEAWLGPVRGVPCHRAVAAVDDEGVSHCDDACPGRLAGSTRRVELAGVRVAGRPCALLCVGLADGVVITILAEGGAW